MSVSCIYKITCITNDRNYIGCTNNLYKRISKHYCELRQNKHINSLLQKDFNDFNEINFNYEIIEICENNLGSREEYYINKLKPYYNIKNINKDIVLSEKDILRFKKNIKILENGCWILGAQYRNKHSNFSIYKNKKYINIAGHRVSYYIFNGRFDSSLQICHKCDNKYCVNPKHLFIGDDSDNHTDRVNKGIGVILNMELASKIRNMYKASKYSTIEIKNLINKEYNISANFSSIRSILLNKTFIDNNWKPIKGRKSHKLNINNIRLDHNNGLRTIDICKKYNIHRSTVHKMCNDIGYKDTK